MNELSLYILDLAQNSVAAKATRIRISIEIDLYNDQIRVFIEDNGCGMDEALLRSVVSPFTTTRKTRKVGLGIPMIKQLCEMCEGEFGIESKVGEGTTLSLTFTRSHVDLPPMGAIEDTLVSLINGSPEDIEFEFSYRYGESLFEFSTQEVRKVLDGVP
ncbi:MAG: ATP-binding protein, partial [Clostridia bacterium]|nr:ATP-binding protein [Clostridia bacterium]